MTRLQFITTLLLAIPGVGWLKRKLAGISSGTIEDDFHIHIKNNPFLDDDLEIWWSPNENGITHVMRVRVEDGIQTTFKDGVLIDKRPQDDPERINVMAFRDNPRQYARWNRLLTPEEQKQVDDYFNFVASQ